MGIAGRRIHERRDVQLQGFQAGFRMYDLGIKKDFTNKRGSIGFGMENFLAPTFKQKNSLETSAFTQNSTNFLYNRGFRVNFSYRLGKMNFVEQKTRRRKSVNNDDQKSDGGGGGDMGGGGQQSGGTPAATPAATGRTREQQLRLPLRELPLRELPLRELPLRNVRAVCL